MLVLFLASTVVFDLVHAFLHRALRSRVSLLRALGGLHQWHHRFADRNLDIHEQYIGQNLRWHVVPEFVIQLAFSMCLLAVLSPAPALGAAAVQTLVFVLILRARGMDINHRPIASLRAYRPLFFCMPEYHALHHVFPDVHLSSWIKLLDYVLGTGLALEGRSIATVGARGPFLAALVEQLRGAGSVERPALQHTDTDEGSGQVQRRLRELDILLLDAHLGDEEVVDWIEGYIAAARGRKLPPEVWLVRAAVSIQGRALLRYRRDPRVIFRFIEVPRRHLGDAPGCQRAARRVLGSLRRGFNYTSAAGPIIGLLRYVGFRLAVVAR